MRERIISSIIVALVGLFYIFVPHEIHISAGADLGLSHGIHIVLGIVLVGISIYYARMKPTAKSKKVTKKRTRRKARRKARKRRRK